MLRHFNVELVHELGGRCNQHWLVEFQGESLVLRRWGPALTEIEYELRLLSAVAALGWPVALSLETWRDPGGCHWSLFPYLIGAPRADKYSPGEQRARGRLLAEFHVGLAQIQGFGQRGTWRRCEATLSDETLEPLLLEHGRIHAEEARVLLWHLERARGLMEGLDLRERPVTLVHGDFTPWNLLFQNGALSGILDFELAHLDYRLGDFPLSWRGQYDEVIHGYNEVAPLEPQEWALLTPLWWAFLIESTCQNLRRGAKDDGWVLNMLSRRSPLMGPDAKAFR